MIAGSRRMRLLLAITSVLPLLFFLVGDCARAAELAVDVRPGDMPDTYIVAVKNTGSETLHVVGQKTRSDSFVTMSFTLRGNYVSSSEGSSEKPAPYLAMESRLASGDRMLRIHPPELAKVSLFDASYENSEFIFFPGREYLCTIRLPSPPEQVDVRWIAVRERSQVQLSRWRANQKQGAFSEN